MVFIRTPRLPTRCQNSERKPTLLPLRHRQLGGRRPNKQEIIVSAMTEEEGTHTTADIRFSRFTSRTGGGSLM